MTAAASQRSRRAYRSPRRQEQAAETRERVLVAATDLFATKGWNGTGMRDVARDAGVAVETVYSNFKSKSELLMAVIDVSVVGDIEPVPLAQRAEFAALSTGDFAARVTAAAKLVTDIHLRIRGVRRALGEGASAEPVLAARLAEAENRRRTDVKRALEIVTGRRVDALERDGIWAVTSVDVFNLLVDVAGWSTHRYQAWMVETLSRLLMDGGGVPA